MAYSARKNRSFMPFSAKFFLHSRLYLYFSFEYHLKKDRAWIKHR
ncbi:hypothetical protein BN1184_BA_00330 [Pantoea ananatis]|nr:hypothetical protein BN1184_BA_00330 [Pantoea ananatis]